jgi:hypothetical protein
MNHRPTDLPTYASLVLEWITGWRSSKPDTAATSTDR